MSAIVLSLLLGAAGILATRMGARRLAAVEADRDPHVYWFLGFAACLPGWLVAFLGLLGAMPTVSSIKPQIAVAVPWVLSAAAALLGAIVTEGALRRATQSAETPAPWRSWRLGLAGSVPAWVIAVAGYALVVL